MAHCQMSCGSGVRTGRLSNDKRRLMSKSLLFFVSVICLFLGWVLSLVHVALTKWISSLSLSITIRLFLLEVTKYVGQSDHSLLLNSFYLSPHCWPLLRLTNFLVILIISVILPQVLVTWGHLVFFFRWLCIALVYFVMIFLYSQRIILYLGFLLPLYNAYSLKRPRQLAGK